MSKQFKANRKRTAPPRPGESARMRMFDLDNPDIGYFNKIDDELIRISGSEMMLYSYQVDDNFDDVYDENRVKAINPQGVLVEGHYDPRMFEENLTEFGIEMTNDQIFTFNKSYIENKLGRPLIAGDVILPRFQNVLFEIYEVQEDNFGAYGVYHLVASARILRDSAQIMKTLDQPNWVHAYAADDHGGGDPWFTSDEFKYGENTTTNEDGSQVLERQLVELSDGYVMDMYIVFPPNINAQTPVHFLWHGAGGSRLGNISWANKIATMGVIAVSPSVRGQGEGGLGNINDPAKYGSLNFTWRQIVDALELPDKINEQVPQLRGNINFRKIGHSGTSQGGYIAANVGVFGGLRPTPTDIEVREGWREAGDSYHKPLFVVSRNFSPQAVNEVIFPRIAETDGFFGNMRRTLVQGFLSKSTTRDDTKIGTWDPEGEPGQGTVYNPEYKSLMIDGILNGGTEKLYDTVGQNDMFFKPMLERYTSYLKQTDVVFYFTASQLEAWAETQMYLNAALENINNGSFRARNWFLNYSSGGHKTTPFVQEQEYAQIQLFAAIKYHLMGDSSMLPGLVPELNVERIEWERLPRVRMAIVPGFGEAARKAGGKMVKDWLNSDYKPDVVYVQSTTDLQDRAMTDFYLRADGSLRFTPSPARAAMNIKREWTQEFGMSDILTIAQEPGFGPTVYSHVMLDGNGKNGEQLLKDNALLFDNQILMNDTPLLGPRFVKDLYVSSTGENVGIGVELYEVQEDTGLETFICGGAYQTSSWGDTSRGFKLKEGPFLNGKFYKLPDIELEQVAYIASRRNQLRLKITPVYAKRRPYQNGQKGIFVYFPYFDSNLDQTIAIDAGWGMSPYLSFTQADIVDPPGTVITGAPPPPFGEFGGDDAPGTPVVDLGHGDYFTPLSVSEISKDFERGDFNTLPVTNLPTVEEVLADFETGDFNTTSGSGHGGDGELAYCIERCQIEAMDDRWNYCDPPEDGQTKEECEEEIRLAKAACIEKCLAKYGRKGSAYRR